jgi:flagellar hook-length control protein FliK
MQAAAAAGPSPAIAASQATPAALAAAITAMHQAGQPSTVLRLDPPGLGSLAVHVALGQAGQVNVLFVPQTTQTAQLLTSGMDGLRQAMAAGGLTLGQASVGGQGAGGQGAPNQGSTSGPPPGQPAPSAPATAAAIQGLSAYA